MSHFCPACKSPDLGTEEMEEDEFGPAYVATICKVCDWRSDEPPITVAGDIAVMFKWHCEGCHLPIKATDLIYRYADDVYVHHKCPTVAQA